MEDEDRYRPFEALRDLLERRDPEKASATERRSEHPTVAPAPEASTIHVPEWENLPKRFEATLEHYTEEAREALGEKPTLFVRYDAHSETWSVDAHLEHRDAPAEERALLEETLESLSRDLVSTAPGFSVRIECFGEPVQALLFGRHL